MRLSNWGQALDSKKGIMCKKIICFLIFFMSLRLLLKPRWVQREAEIGGRYPKMGAGGTFCFVSSPFAVRRAFRVVAMGRTRFAFCVSFTATGIHCFPGLSPSFPIDAFWDAVLEYSEYLYPQHWSNAMVLIATSFRLVPLSECVVAGVLGLTLRFIRGRPRPDVGICEKAAGQMSLLANTSGLGGFVPPTYFFSLFRVLKVRLGLRNLISCRGLQAQPSRAIFDSRSIFADCCEFGEHQWASLENQPSSISLK